ncbi:MAG: sigma-70 family RNA polymerase sigma factor [Myxococcales bacterium]|nr:sigma-70 family RNA polymerase sigma factor [Myxococcales bacterium]
MASDDSTLSEYIQRVRAIPRLSREDELEAARRAQAGDQQAADRLVESNLRYAVAVALQYRRYGIPIWELIAEGSLGLTLAVNKFDPDRGTRFVTYAGYWIRAYILDLVVRSARLVGAGSGVLRSKLYFRLRRERAQVASHESDPERSVAILAERFGVSETKMRGMLLQLDAKDVSLNVTLRSDGELTMLDLLADEGADQEHELVQLEQQTQTQSDVRQALTHLDRRERYIVEQRIMGDEGLSLAELGRRLGVSRERARQLEARAKRKLRRQLEAGELASTAA